MKALVIIVASVLLAIWFVVDFVWFRALSERAGDLKEVSDKLDKLDRELQLKKAKLQTEEDRQRVASRMHKEERDKLNEKAELLDRKEAELRDFEKMLDDAKKELKKKPKKKCQDKKGQ